MDSGGDIWGYSVNSGTGMLTSLGIVASGQTNARLQIYGSGVLWAAISSLLSPTITVTQFPINSGGTLGSSTTVSLAGVSFEPFIPAGATVPSAVWAFGTALPVGTCNVYSVSSSGFIGGTPIQTLSAPSLVLASTTAFAYGVSSPGISNTQSLYTFSTSANGTLTAVSTVSLPPLTSSSLWEPVAAFVPEIGSTLDLFNTAGAFAVYPVGATGSVGSPLQTTTLASTLPLLPFSITINTSTGQPSLTLLPILWSTSSGSITEYPIGSNGTLGASSGSVAAGAQMLPPLPPESPFSWGVDQATSNIYAYGVNASTGALTLAGTFSGPPLAAGTSELVAPFLPPVYSTTPVALFVYQIIGSTGGATVNVTVYPLASTGLASGAPITTITSAGQSVESFIVLQNGRLVQSAFGGG